MRSHRALTGSALLTVLLVAAAGITGAIHFAGPRWVPHWNLTPQTQASVPPPPVASKPPTRTSAAHTMGSFPLWIVLWIMIAIAAIGVALLLWRWWSGRPSRAATRWHSIVVDATSSIPVEQTPEPDTPALRTGIELALQLLDEQREPADAIVRAWLGLQEAAQGTGIVRRPAETPTEFATRILSRAFADDRAIRTLLRLYLRTRFGDHPVTGNDVRAVRAALEELARTWPAPASLAGSRRR